MTGITYTLLRGTFSRDPYMHRLLLHAFHKKNPVPKRDEDQSRYHPNSCTDLAGTGSSICVTCKNVISYFRF